MMFGLSYCPLSLSALPGRRCLGIEIVLSGGFLEPLAKFEECELWRSSLEKATVLKM
jgi:hypothetical protein